MKFNKYRYTQLAAVSVMAIGVGLCSAPNHALATYSGPAAYGYGSHAGYELDSDNPVTVEVDAYVEAAVTVQETDMSLGMIGIHQDKTGATLATFQLKTDGTHTIVNAVPQSGARIVSDGTAGNTFGGANANAIVPASIDLTGAFPLATIYVHYTNVKDLACFTTAGAVCTSATLDQGGTVSAYTAPKLKIVDVDDALAVGGPTVGTGSTAGHWDTGGHTDGQAATDSTGELKWKIGVTISTDTTTHSYYATGLYAGSFDVTLSY